MRKLKLAKALKNFLFIAVPVVIIAGGLIYAFNTIGPDKFTVAIQQLTGQGIPPLAQSDLFDRLRQLAGNDQLYYTITSAQHASSPARHWNPLVNKALDMWCVVVNPPSEIRVIDDGNRQLRSFIVYQTRVGGRWHVTDGIAVFQSDQSEFESVGCTNYQR
jgi:hypothetical protein